jgi:hypothetical protein
VTYLGLIERKDTSALERILFRPKWQRREQPKPAHSAAATRFASTCAALGGTTMLRDLMPDIVTVSFGPRTSDIYARLRARGWKAVGKGDWGGEPVLGVTFGSDRQASRKADELVEALVQIMGEMEMAETRVW